MSLTEEYEAAKATLVAGGFTESQISRMLKKPKRAYTKDSNWKEEAMSVYIETGIITRQQIKSTSGFPTSSNPSQTVKRFIGWLQGQTGDDLSHDKKADAWSVQEDLSQHYDFFIKHFPMTKASFEANCSKRGVDPDAIKNAFNGQVRTLSDGTMELIP